MSKIFEYNSPGQNFEPVGCARCGCEAEFELCGQCGGEGCTSPGELYEQDPLWYDMDDIEICNQCGGTGGWYYCVNSKAFCEASPMDGRESVEHGLIEWKQKDAIGERMM